MKYPQDQIKPYNNDRSKTEQVEQMFDHIAPAYDRLNHTLSFGIDKYWRKKAIKNLKKYSPNTIMDVATGTGDFAILTYEKIHPDKMVGIDISEGMMKVAKTKVEKKGLAQHILFEKEDCQNLSYHDNSFDAVTVAFGVRNFENLDQGLKEIYRVLTKEGHLVILELTSPTYFPMKQLYSFYSKKIIPFIGKTLSKDQNAYTYLPESIKLFPQKEEMINIIKKAGFTKAKYISLTMGICTLYIAQK